ncbi:hypothetical protein HK405_011192, partial [Cladochytrium tenue]
MDDFFRSSNGNGPDPAGGGGVGGAPSFGGGGGFGTIARFQSQQQQSPEAVFQTLEELVVRRSQTLAYLKRLFGGRSFYMSTALITSDAL